MKVAIGLIVLTVVGAAVAVVLAVTGTRDTAPRDLRACATRGGAGVMLSDADLGAPVRLDLESGDLRVARREKQGDDTALLLDGSGYRVLVLAGRHSPPITGDVARRVYLRTSDYAFVAKETDPVRVLADCLK